MKYRQDERANRARRRTPWEIHHLRHIVPRGEISYGVVSDVVAQAEGL
jgi:hypothetical protein